MADCARAAADGLAQVVWLEGNPGMGKTALLRRALQGLPPEFSVLRAEADELAVEIPMAVVAHFGDVTSASPFAAGLELLEQLSALQESGPVSVVIEDIHWADVSSRQALLTTARRLGHDQVIMFITTRLGAADDDGWHRFSLDTERCRRITLQPLTVAEVAEIARRSHVALAHRDAQRLHRHTGGHPLYVRTLIDELTAEQLTNPDGDLPAPRSLASAAIARLASVSAESRDLAYGLSVANQRIPLARAAAIADVENGAAALEGLLRTGFITWNPSEPETPIQFSHPLHRAALYEHLTPTKRQQLHLRAAGVLGLNAALAHRVAAADGVDKALARELADASQAEIVKGSDDQAATYLLWASSLESGRQLAEDYLLQATYLLLAGWRTARAKALRARVIACAPRPLRSLVLGLLAKDEGDRHAAERWLSDAIALAAEHDPDRKQLPRALAELALLFSMQGLGTDAVKLADRAISLRPSEADTEQIAWVAVAIGEAMRHRGDGRAGSRRLVQRLPRRRTRSPSRTPISSLSEELSGTTPGRSLPRPPTFGPLSRWRGEARLQCSFRGRTCTSPRSWSTSASGTRRSPSAVWPCLFCPTSGKCGSRRRLYASWPHCSATAGSGTKPPSSSARHAKRTILPPPWSPPP